MVKPIFPSQHYDAPQVRQPASANNSAVNTQDNVGGVYPGLLDEDVLRTVGYASNEDAVFSSHALLRSQSFQPYDDSLPRTFPTPAPRERLSSLPDHQDDEITSISRERRKSAPVPVTFSDSASSSTCYETSSLPAPLHDIAVKGQELFWFILSEEVKALERDSPGSLSALTISPSSQRTLILNERGSLGGRTLRQITEAFSQSSHRMRVREYAESVPLQGMHYNSFFDLLFGLFQEGGVTQARVLVLFFFCADVALRALRENLTEQFQQLVDWTSRYITDRLSAWVLDHGGWAAVLQESVDQVYKLVVIGVCVVGIAALCTMVWKQH